MDVLDDEDEEEDDDDGGDDNDDDDDQASWREGEYSPKLSAVIISPLSSNYQFWQKFRTFHLKKNFIAFLQIVSPHNQGRSGQTKELQGKKIFRKLAEVCVDVITAEAQVVEV